MRWQSLCSDEGAAVRIAAVGFQQDLSYTEAASMSALSELGIPAQFVGLDVPRPEFVDCIHHLRDIGFKGVFVLNPFKVDAARVAERFWVAKYPLGVANSLLFDRGIFAQNTEVAGISACVRHIEPGFALVMGTGHAARSVIAGLLDAGFKIKTWNRNANKTKILKSLLERYGHLELAPNPDPSGCRLVVNATPLGVKLGQEPPIMWGRVNPRTVCFDLVFRRVPTDFLRNARTRGLPTIDGRELLVEQVAIALEWWMGRQMPREAMKTAVGLKRPTVGV